MMPTRFQRLRGRESPDPAFDPGDPPDPDAPTAEDREEERGRATDAAYMRHVDK